MKQRLNAIIDFDTYFLLKAYCQDHSIKFSGLVNALLNYGISRLFEEEYKKYGCK